MAEVVRTDEFNSWLLKLKDKLTRARIVARVERLELSQLGDVRWIDPDMFEMRMHFGPGYRAYVLRDGNEFVIVLCGGDKSTQQKDIEKAREIAKKWRKGVDKHDKVS